MKNPTPRQIAFSSSISLALLIVFCSIVIKRFNNEELGWYAIAILSGSSFILGYIIFLYALKRFIYRKIKVIYKKIYDTKTSKGSISGKVKMEKDVIREVKKDVMDWAKDEEEEIEQLRKLETFRKEFLGNVSHELKTPVFNLQGYIETLVEGGINDDNINMEYLRNASKNVERLNTILEDLEMISLIENEKLEREREKFDILEDRKSTRLNSSHIPLSRMPSSA